MPIYWSMLLMTIAIGILCYRVPLKKTIVGGQQMERVRVGFVFILLTYIVFFVGFRDKVLDTGAYINSFNDLPTSLDGLLSYLDTVNSGKGFYFISGIFKIFVSDNHYVWLFFIAIISCGFLFRTIYKYSVDFPLSAYLFIASATFTWLLNGTRQFLVVCILLGFVDWLIDGKKIQYIILSLLLSTIHNSAIFVGLIVLFVSSQKIFSKKMFIFVLFSIIGTYYSEFVFKFLSDTSDAMNYVDTMVTDGGSNILRFVITIIPVSIVILNYNNVKNIAPPFIKLAINMSIVGSCFYLAATFTNGVLVGRMPIYFTVYNLYLLPWVINNCFTNKSKKIVWLLCVLFYFIYFYYQMCIAWDGLMYVSNALNISYY